MDTTATTTKTATIFPLAAVIGGIAVAVGFYLNEDFPVGMYEQCAAVALIIFTALMVGLMATILAGEECNGASSAALFLVFPAMLAALLFFSFSVMESEEELNQTATQIVNSYGLEVVEIEDSNEYGDYIYVEATDGTSYYELYLRENEDGSYSLYKYKDGVYSLYSPE